MAKLTAKEVRELEVQHAATMKAIEVFSNDYLPGEIRHPEYRNLGDWRQIVNKLPEVPGFLSTKNMISTDWDKLSKREQGVLIELAKRDFKTILLCLLRTADPTI